MTYKDTIRTSYVGNVVQSIVNCFPPILYVTFNTQFGIPYEKITMLAVLNFTVQLVLDYISTKFIDKIGPRLCFGGAHILAALGTFLMAFLPSVMPAFPALVIATVFSASGGGLIEVVNSPIVEACPTKNKAAQMSLLHSFYCWGTVFVVTLSTLALKFSGMSSWQYIAAFWALVPAVNAVFCFLVPIENLVEDGEGMSVRELFSQRIFIILIMLMVCSGACELAMSQWASAFAEKGLGVSKTVGDLFGPCLFAVLMGISRVFYAKIGHRINIVKYTALCGALCVIAYLLAAFAPYPALSLVGCGLCGFSVGIMWPGTYSISSVTLKKGGNSMFAILALGGDIGCSAGPMLVGLLAGKNGEGLVKGIACGTFFPIMLLVFVFMYSSERRKNCK